MKISVLILLSLLLLACANEVYYTPTNALNLRDRPSQENSTIITVLRPGASLEFLEQSGGWIHVRIENGVSGWVSARYVTKSAGGNRISRVSNGGSNYFSIRIADSWNNIRSYAVLFYVMFFIAIGLLVCQSLELHPGIGVFIGIACYIFMNFSIVTFNANITLFVILNIAIGVFSSAFSGIGQGRAAARNPIFYITGILAPILAILFGIFSGISEIYIVYLVLFFFGFITSFSSISDFMEEMSRGASSMPITVVIITLISLFSVAHMPKIWPPLVYFQGGFGILGFFAGNNE